VNGLKKISKYLWHSIKSRFAGFGGLNKKGWGRVKIGLMLNFFAFFKIIHTFAVTNQIFLPFKGVWFLLRRVERLGSAKPWQPILNISENGAKT
jgi:hypothetical protein